MEKVKILRIYLSSTDKYKHQPLYEAIVQTAKRNGIAGATVYKGLMGYGSSSELESPLFWEINEKLPITIEIIDTEDKINSFLDNSLLKIEEQSIKGCLIVSFEADLVLKKLGTQE